MAPYRSSLTVCLAALLACVGCNGGGGSGGFSGSTPYMLPGAGGSDGTGLGGKDASGGKDGAIQDANPNEGAADATPTDSDEAPDANLGGADKAAAKPEDYIDKDDDGLSPAEGDCDDANPAVRPGAIEACNGVDDDCDGSVDLVDHDKDGYSKCPGAKQDCNDADAKSFPGAKASNCKPGVDMDCSGVPDLEEDDDSDGVPRCKDCDDKDAGVFPGAAPNCVNGKDNDCDGQVDGLVDFDKDGDPACSDCDDKDPKVFVMAPETCNSKDDDCNGLTDDKDKDGDGWSGCGPDCDDNDLTINPIAGRDCKNGKDNDCNGKIDAQEDGDGDGFVGCQDCNDYNTLVAPSSIEFGGDNMDNDCDGQTDELPTSCDQLGLNSNNAGDFAKSIDLCSGVQSTSFPTVAASNAKAIKTVYGAPNVPIKGPSFVVMSSGVAAAAGQPGYVSPQSGSSFSNSMPYPAGVQCKNTSTLYDYTEWKLVLKVPANAQAFSFDFNFMSAEYPEYVNSSYDDKFLAILDSKNFKGNVSFDKNGKCISINSALFQVCTGCSQGAGGLQGTGYENGIGGGTGWLTTTVPVQPGETVTLRFLIFDEGDHILDSVVLIDDFRWLSSAKSGGPSTIRPGSG